MILTAWVLSAADFSHRKHLALKLECVQCHKSATSSTRPDDNNLPKPESCRPCHEKAEIGRPRQTNVAKFNHQLHAKFPNIAQLVRNAIDRRQYLAPPGDLKQRLEGATGCTACHAGTAQSDKAVHAEMATCLVCHNQIELPYSCSYCHAKDADLKPANHVEAFHDTHTRKSVEKIGCAVCHGRNFRCLGCH